MDLFTQENTVYIIDSSGLIRLESTFKKNNPVFSAIWDEIEDLIRSGCFKTIDFVEDETSMADISGTQAHYLTHGCSM